MPGLTMLCIIMVQHIDKDKTSMKQAHYTVRQSPPGTKLACRTHLFLYQVGGRQDHQVDLTAQLQGGLGGIHLIVEAGMQNQDL